MKNLFILISCFLITNVSAQDTWGVDPSNSSIEFKVAHLLISNVTGSFNIFKAQLETANSDSFQDAKVEAIIDVKSIDTRNKQRDNHLKQSDFFDTEKYPEIKFENGSLKIDDDKAVTVTGDLTLKEITKKVTLKGLHGGQATMWGQKRAGFTAEGKINRFDFGLSFNEKLDNGNLLVGEEVTIILNLEFVKQ